MDSTVEHSHTRFRNTGMTEADASDHQLIIFKNFFAKMLSNRLCYQNFQSFNVIEFSNDVSKSP